MNKTTLGLCLALAAGSCFMTGCDTTTTTTTEGTSQKLTSSGFDTQDFAVKGEEMVNSLLESGVLDKAAQHPAVIAIGRIVHETVLVISYRSYLLMKKIRVALNKNGKAITDTTGGVLNTLDFTFSGKLIDTDVRVGNKSQHTYTFQLSLDRQQRFGRLGRRKRSHQDYEKGWCWPMMKCRSKYNRHDAVCISCWSRVLHFKR